MHDVNAKLYSCLSGFATFAEESTLWRKVSAPVFAGGLGFGYKWNMGWMNDVLDFIKCDPIHRRDKYHSLVRTASYAFDENFVLPLSHDEVVHCKGSLLNKAPGNDADKFATLKALLAFQWTYPGRKLLFMGGEFAASSEWNELGELNWHEAEEPRRRSVASLVRALNSLYMNEPDFHANDSAAGSFHWVVASDANRSITAFMRGNFLVVANWASVRREDYRLPLSGEYEEVLSTDWFDYHGSGFGNGTRDACSLTLPPLSVIIMKKRC
jgi:1,4-alpha-glucan branching enzyme